MGAAALAVGLGVTGFGAVAPPAFAGASTARAAMGGCTVAFHSVHCRTSRDRDEWASENCFGGGFADCLGMRHCRFVGRFTIVCERFEHRRRRFPEEIEAGAGGTSQGVDVMTVLAGLGVAAAGAVLVVRRRMRAAA